MRLGKNIITHFVKEYPVSTVPSKRTIHRRVEKLQMTGFVLGKRKYRNQCISLMKHVLH
jgi:hypothetical protein